MKGCYHAIGKPADRDRVSVYQAYATSASIHEVTDKAVTVAFNAGNVMPVEIALRAEYPELAIILAVDDNVGTKSSAQNALRRLVDPKASDLRSPPKSVKDVFVSAGVNWFSSFEKVSHLTRPMQDALAVLVTGGGFAKRKLYPYGNESVINVMRPVVLNCIPAILSISATVNDSAPCAIG